MFEYLSIGSSPNAESCAQVGSDDYGTKSVKECNAYRNQLYRVYGEPPSGAILVIKSSPHDFGTYREVNVRFDEYNQAAVKWAYEVEAGCENWDSLARKELGL